MVFASKENARDRAPKERQIVHCKTGNRPPAYSFPQADRILQRSLGNSYLQAISQTNQQSTATQIQRACSCGSTCKSCQPPNNDRPMLQPQLAIGAPNDKYEQEADRIAEQVMRMPAPGSPTWKMATLLQPPPIQRQSMAEEEETLQPKPLAEQITPCVQRQTAPIEEEEEPLQTQPQANQITTFNPKQPKLPEEEELTLQTRTVSDPLPIASARFQTIQKSEGTENSPASVDREIERSIQSERSTGDPLSETVRTPMEQTFGVDFSSVRIHTNDTADRLNRALHARAFTTGQDIFFGKGEYNPNSLMGRGLLAHELTHVVQQEGSKLQRKSQPKPQPKPQLGQSEPDAVLRHLQTMQQQPGFDPSLYRKEIAEFQQAHPTEQIWAQQAQILRKPEGVNVRERDNSQAIRRYDKDKPTEKDSMKEEAPPAESPAETPPSEKTAFNVDDVKCDPEPKTLAEIETAAGESGVLGYTKPNPISLNLGIKSESEKCKLDVKQEPTLSFQHLVYTKPGTYKVGKVEIPFDPCKGKIGDYYYRITDEMAEKIKQGEIEHCEDNKLAFKLSYGKYYKALQEVAAEDLSGKDDAACQAEVVKRFEAKTGIEVSKLKTIADCLLNKTHKRDDEGWHTVDVKDATKGKFELEADCSKLTLTLDHTKQLTEVNKHPSKDVVKGCGE